MHLQSTHAPAHAPLLQRAQDASNQHNCTKNQKLLASNYACFNFPCIAAGVSPLLTAGAPAQSPSDMEELRAAASRMRTLVEDAYEVRVVLHLQNLGMFTLKNSASLLMKGAYAGA